SARAKTNGMTGRMHGLKMVSTPPKNARTNRSMKWLSTGIGWPARVLLQLTPYIEGMQRRRFLMLGAAAAAASRLPSVAPEPRRVLYVSGSVSPLVVEGLQGTRFNTLILAFVYARWQRGKLALTLNGLPGARLGGTAANLKRLRGTRVLASLGGWGNAATFAAIQRAGVGRFLDQFEHEIAGPLGLSGMDLDLEPGTVAENTPAGWKAVHDQHGGLLVALTNEYARRHPAHAVTHAPIAGVEIARRAWLADRGDGGKPVVAQRAVLRSRRPQARNHRGVLQTRVDRPARGGARCRALGAALGAGAAGFRAQVPGQPRRLRRGADRDRRRARARASAGRILPLGLPPGARSSGRMGRPLVDAHHRSNLIPW